MRFNYIEKISMKRDAKKMKHYQICEVISALNYCQLSVNYHTIFINEYQ